MTLLWEQNFWPVVWAVAVVASAWAAWVDVRTHRIPNILTGPLWLGGIVWSTWVGGWMGLGESLLACVALALPFVLLYAFAGGGAGDAKMMGALGAWLGLIGGTAALVSVAICGGVLALCFALAQGRVKAVCINMAHTLGGFIWVLMGYLRPKSVSTCFPSQQQMHPMPYGLAIATGVAVAAGGTYLWHVT